MSPASSNPHWPAWKGRSASSTCKAQHSNAPQSIMLELYKKMNTQTRKELKETRLVWDEIGTGEVRRREKCVTTLKVSTYYTILRQTAAKQDWLFFINRKYKDHIVRENSISPRVAELVMCMTKRYKLNIVQEYAPTNSYPEEHIIRL